MTDKQLCTELIKSDLENKGFEVRHNIAHGLIVSLARQLFMSEVRMALYNKGYDDAQFQAKQSNVNVIVEAIA